MSTPTLLKVTDLVRHYALPREKLFSPPPTVKALNGVSFEVQAGRSLGIVGESGSGKSTIARLVMALDKPTSGRIELLGRDLNQLSAAELRTARRDFQMVFQDPYGSLDRRLSVQQALVAAMRLHGLADREGARRRAGELLDRVRLTEEQGALRPHQLSGGQRQRVAIARALAVSPTLLVLDEAVSALDVSVQAQILELVDEIRREAGIAVLFVSHDLAVVDEIADRVLVLYRGDVVEEGPASAVFRAPEHAYTRLLVSSVPGPGWDPHEVIARRREFDAAR